MRSAQIIDKAMAAQRGGDLSTAKKLYRKLLKKEPKNVTAHLHLAYTLRAQGNLSQALDHLKQVIALEPENIIAWFNYGNAIRLHTQNASEPIPAFQKCIELDPNFIEAHVNLARSYLESNNLEDALTFYHKALAIKPNLLPALIGLGRIALKQKNYVQALQHFRNAEKLEPNKTRLLEYFGECHYSLNQPKLAVKYYEKALATVSNALYQSSILSSLGVAYQADGKFQESKAAFEKSLSLNANEANTHCNFGALLRNLQDYDKSIFHLDKALSLDSEFTLAFANKGYSLFKCNRIHDAIDSCNKALAIEPGNVIALLNIGLAYANIGNLVKSEESFKRLIQDEPKFSKAYSNLAACVNYSEAYTAEQVMAEQNKVADSLSDLVTQQTEWQTLRDPNKRLKIGYVSADFYQHATSRFLESILANHNHQTMEIICYNNTPKSDAATIRFKSYSDTWREVATKQDAELAELIRQDEIDILIDLSAHTAGNRLLVFAEKPAPIQITLLGFPNGTGLRTMDYIITDANSIPESAESLYREKPLRMPNYAWCLWPPKELQPIKPLPAIENGFITFASFNHIPKINDTVIKTWSKLMLSLPKSRLLLKGRAYADRRVAEDIAARFFAHGLTTQQLAFEGPSTIEHLFERYNDVDIALDPFPFNGSTTTCDALLMGVPTITLDGKLFAGRMCASILKTLDLNDWVASSLDDYCDLTKNHASDFEKLNQLRQNLRQTVLNSPLCDQSRYIQAFEQSLRQVWCEYCAQS